MCYDVAIIGAGVIGALTARELSKYNLKTVLLEATNDVAMGASKANSGIVHAGFDAKPGTLKAELNVKGCLMMEELCKKLSVPYKKNGSLVVAFSEEEMHTLKDLYDRGVANGVPELRIIDKDELKAVEPNLSENVFGALDAESAGIVCPYELTIAATENAVVNGVEFKRNFRVSAISFCEGIFTVKAASDEIKTKYIVNAAGAYSDDIARMIGDESVNLIMRRGEYFILDKSVGDTVSHTIFQCPTKMGKGILVSPTVDGNLLIGPTAEDIEDKEDKSTTLNGFANIKQYAVKSCPSVSTRNAITSFTGLRAHPVNDDFILGASKINPQFIHASGIESPGLTSAPAIAEYLVDIIIKSMVNVEKNSDFDGCREDVFRFRHATDEERIAAIEKNPAYGRIVCRCETITEGEIIDAIKAPAGARDVDGVKRRTRAGMGRCQGGFCGSKVVEILARELGTEINDITKFGNGSNILFDKTK